MAPLPWGDYIYLISELNDWQCNSRISLCAIQTLNNYLRSRITVNLSSFQAKVKGLALDHGGDKDMT